jgi:hypothetical protein
MSHWAQLDENNIVLQVLVGDNNDPNGDEGYRTISESLGGHWVKTSYNGNFRKNYAGIGFYYSEDMDAFIAPQPFTSWTLNEETCQWVAPIEIPEDGQPYLWDEENIMWVKID